MKSHQATYRKKGKRKRERKVKACCFLQKRLDSGLPDSKGKVCISADTDCLAVSDREETIASPQRES